MRCVVCYKSYSRSVSAAAPKPEPSTEPIATTTRGGVTEVDTDVLLSQPSVQRAIRVLSEKADGQVSSANTSEKK